MEISPKAAAAIVAVVIIVVTGLGFALLSRSGDRGGPTQSVGMTARDKQMYEAMHLGTGSSSRGSRSGYPGYPSSGGYPGYPGSGGYRGYPSYPR
jgi:hypothetical protein